MLEFDVIVAGAGVIGLSAAWRLAELGAKVVVLDPDQKGGRGSRAAAGVAIPSVRFSTNRHLNEFARQGLQALEADLQQFSAASPIEQQGCGVIRVISKESEKELLETAIAKSGNVPGIFHTRDELVHLEPALEGSSILGGFVHEKGFVVNANSYIDALIYEATRRGVSLRLGDAVREVEAEKQGITVHTKTGSLRGAWFVLAAGAWSGTIVGLPSLPIFPLRGQMLVVTHPLLSLTRLISGRSYLAPWQNGGVMVGATEEQADFNDHNTPDGLIYLLGVLNHFAPLLREAQITRIWAGLRSATRNGSPLIGLYPGMPRVIIASGHTGQGILTGALTGKVVTDLVNSGRSDIATAFEVASQET